MKPHVCTECSTKLRLNIITTVQYYYGTDDRYVGTESQNATKSSLIKCMHA